MKLTDLYETFDRYQLHDLANPIDKEVEKVTDVTVLAKKIEANCKTMLAAYRQAGGYLYRGMAGASAPVIVTGIRPDRSSVEMPPEAHEALHNLFLDQGLTVTRKNSIFCTAAKKIARDWGTTYVIFVKDGWTGLVFDDVPDDYSFYRIKSAGWSMVKGREYEAANDLRDLKPREFTSSSDLAKIIDRKYHEALIKGDSYIAVKYGTGIWDELKYELKI